MSDDDENQNGADRGSGQGTVLCLAMMRIQKRTGDGSMSGDDENTNATDNNSFSFKESH